MKQTAVEWLLGTLEQNDIIGLDSVNSDKYYDIINQAKAMEKDQMKETAIHFFPTSLKKEHFEQYYNETYGKE